jgi:hypothetical protein
VFDFLQIQIRQNYFLHNRYKEMPRTFRQDYAFGKSKEVEVLSSVRSHFADDVDSSVDNFSIYDFKGRTYHYELKSRTNALMDYPTTLLPCSKVFTDKQIFLFNFTDGLYYIEYNKEVFATFEQKSFVRNRRTDYVDKPQMYYYIPVSLLQPISNETIFAITPSPTTTPR